MRRPLSCFEEEAGRRYPLFWALVESTGIQVESFDATHMMAAVEAYAPYGKGMHPIGLNFGDCPVYALAKLHNEPVLSTSNEFERAGLPRIPNAR